MDGFTEQRPRQYGNKNGRGVLQQNGIGRRGELVGPGKGNHGQRIAGRTPPHVAPRERRLEQIALVGCLLPEQRRGQHEEGKETPHTGDGKRIGVG